MFELPKAKIIIMPERDDEHAIKVFDNQWPW